MGFDFTFRLVGDMRDLRNLEGFLIMQNLGYPNYEDWVRRAIEEIDRGYKQTVLAFSDSKLVGDLVFQEHKDIIGLRELKNMRVHPDVRGRYFAHFMLKQAEVESPRCDAIICDLRTDHPQYQAMINILLVMGYAPLLRAPLYDPNILDVVMAKQFERSENILYTAKKFILSRAL